MDIKDRQLSEKSFYDSYYDKSLKDEDLVLSSDFKPVVWVEDAVRRLGELSGKRILDIGCGTGVSSVYLAKGGAEVFAIDISRSAIEITKRRAKINRVSINIFQMAVEELGFKRNYFDAVFGNAVLHHIDLESATREIHRVMKIQGRAIFNETTSLNPIFRLLRSALPGRFGIPRKRTRHEKPVDKNDISILMKTFKQVNILRSYKFLSQAEGYIFSPHSRIAKYLNIIDNIILRNGFAKKFGYRINIECIK